MTWEYKKLYCDASVDEMNALGANGWNNYWNTTDPYGRIDIMFWKRLVD